MGGGLLIASLLIAFGGTRTASAQQTYQERGFLESAARSLVPGLGAYDAVQDLGARLGDAAWDATPTMIQQGVTASVRGLTVEQAVREGLPTTGSITDMLTARLVGFLAFVMGLVVSFLGKMILLLVNILLGFLTYNGFADAPPVITGWKIVRDLVNMFFIVVLIVASYATILGGKDELHVKKILPKLLIAAVLVNFSKTIVALLIDASQVVMLTFVNAFAAIGAGNFTNALHLPQISESSYAGQLEAAVTSTAQQVGTAGAGQVILDVILAAALQIILLVIAIGVVLMMIVFVVVRIVGLWMLLIFSPIPFLTSALPQSIKSSLGKQVDSFWSRLSGFLVGGPIMAFWLWLTFATLSAQGTTERLGLFQNVQTAEVTGAFQVGQSAISMFITRIGNAQGLGSYVIAVTMMMMGLEAAMDVAGKVGGSAGDLMSTIGKKSKGYALGAARMMTYGGAAGAGILAARGAIGAATLAGRGTKAVAGAGLGLVDRRYDLRGKLGRAASRVPGIRGTEWAQNMQMANRNDAAKRAMAMSRVLNDPLATDEEKDIERNRIRSSLGMYGDLGSKRAVADDYLKSASNERDIERRLKPTKDAVKAAVASAPGVDDQLARRVANRRVQQESGNERVRMFESARGLVDDGTQQGHDRLQTIDDGIKKIRSSQPHLIMNEEERAKQMKNVPANFTTLDEDARSNFEVLRHFGGEAFKEEGGRITLGDDSAIRGARKKLEGKNRENFDAMVNYVRDMNGGVAASDLRHLSVEQDAAGDQRIFRSTVDERGLITGGAFQMSDRHKETIQRVQTQFSDSEKTAWLREEVGHDAATALHPRPSVEAGAAARLMDAAKVVGVSQVINSVGAGASAAEAPRMREAAVHSLSDQVAARVQATSNNLQQKRPAYQDINGKEVASKTNAQILNDKNAPPSVRARALAEYQAQVAEVLPVLQGMKELPVEEQIEFMAAIGKEDVGRVLNSGMMADPALKLAAQDLKITMNDNRDHIESYFSKIAPDELQGMDDYHQSNEYDRRMNATDEGRQKMQGLETVAGYTDAQRTRFFAEHPDIEPEYREYARNAAAKARVAASNLEASDGFTERYSTYVKYDRARNALNLINASGGKGGSSSNRPRGGSST